MAIDAHSTTAPVVQMGLLPAGFSGAVPLPTPDLTAETVALLTEVFPEIGKNPEVRADVRHGGAPICSAADLPCGAAGDVRYDGTGDAAQALHMRRALEGALDHGTALLAALGLPRVAGPGFVPLDPAAIGDALDTAISTLDAMDAPGADLEDGHDAEHDLADAEHDLGWPACMSQVNLGRNTEDGDLTALERHGRGFLRSGPDDAEDDDPSGSQQGDEDAPFWSVDVGCAMGAPVDMEDAHV